ncbi:MAG: hypothetical protein AAF387_09810 [Pseudomonadota bacterium]
MEINVDSEKNIAMVVMSGEVSPQSVIETVQAMLSHPAFSPTMSSIWDYRHCVVGEFPLAELKRVGDLAHATKDINYNAKIALVVGDDLQFGLSRMFVMLNEFEHVEFRPFRDIDTAEDWICGRIEIDS